jgi:hypothetical protein
VRIAPDPKRNDIDFENALHVLGVFAVRAYESVHEFTRKPGHGSGLGLIARWFDGRLLAAQSGTPRVYALIDQPPRITSAVAP